MNQKIKYFEKLIFKKFELIIVFTGDHTTPL